MESAVDAASNGDAESVQLFVRQARSLIALLRDHIAKEDDCLANVVHRAFSSEDLVRLAGEFEEAERREIGAGAFERFAAIVEALEARRGAGGPAHSGLALTDSSAPGPSLYFRSL